MKTLCGDQLGSSGNGLNSSGKYFKDLTYPVYACSADEKIGELKIASLANEHNKVRNFPIF